MSIRFGAAYGTFAFAALVSLSPAAARPLTYDAALALAAKDAPSLRARALEVDAQRSATTAAGQLPDPRLGVGIDNYPVSGPPAFSFDRDNMTMARVGLSQDIPNGAKRHARTVRAEANVGEAEAMRLVELRRVRVETAVAWIDLFYAERRLGAVEAQIATIGRLRSPAVAGVASGSARPAQALEVRRALLTLEDKSSDVAAEIARARAALSRWTGDPDPDLAGPLPDLEVNMAALHANIDSVPSLGLLSARTRQADADVALARADKKPDFGVDLAYQRRADRYGDMVSAGVTVTLPLFARRRQDPIIAARSATAAAARAEEEDARRALAAEIESGLADHVMHHEQWMRAREELLPLARERADLETASYGAGRAGLLDVIEARTALADAELEVLDREAMVARDAARLTLTYGSDLR
jgi:outer membrane protein, heavy metal efflux system